VIWMTTSEILAHTDLPVYLKENIKLAVNVLQDSLHVL